MKPASWPDAIIEARIRAAGYSAMVCVGLIMLFLLRKGLPALGEVELGASFGAHWYPIENHFGL
jgi:ABC-type phosphate transport system permease subunit